MTEVLEGEVVDESTSRRQERNAGRVLDVLPPSREEKLAAMSRMTPEQQVDHVTELLVHSHAGLLVAIAAQDLPGIAEAKQKAATIQEIAKQLRMGKDMQLHAAEFVRRAERGLGVAIREGQDRGEILVRGEVRNRQNQYTSGEQGQALISKPSPTDFAKGDELHSSRGHGIYDMTDGVSDAQFEEAITEAREEGNLSRANVARKAKAKAQHKEPIDADDPLIDAEVEAAPSAPAPAPAPKKRLTKHDSAEMVANINGMLNGIVETLPFIDPAEVDFTDKGNRRNVESIRVSLARIRKLLKEIENG